MIVPKKENKKWIKTYPETHEAEISAAGTWGRLKSPQLMKSRLNQKTMNTIKTNYIPSNQAQNACSWWVARSRRVSLKVAAWSLKVAAKSLKVAAPPKQKRNGQKQEKNINVNNFLFVFERAPNLQAQVTAPKVAANKSKSPHKLWGRNSCR